MDDKAADAIIRGQTTEAVLRMAQATDTADPKAIIAALVRRYDRKAEKRAGKAE